MNRNTTHMTFTVRNEYGDVIHVGSTDTCYSASSKVRLVRHQVAQAFGVDFMRLSVTEAGGATIAVGEADHVVDTAAGNE